MKSWKLCLLLIPLSIICCSGIVLADATPHLPSISNGFSSTSTSAYPNPFNESTTIFYSATIDEYIKIKLYNNKGQLLNELFNDEVEKGQSYRFELDGRALNPGTYYYTIEAGGNIIHQRLDLVR